MASNDIGKGATTINPELPESRICHFSGCHGGSLMPVLLKLRPRHIEGRKDDFYPNTYQ